jgi:hypothetical protein
MTLKTEEPVILLVIDSESEVLRWCVCVCVSKYDALDLFCYRNIMVPQYSL